MYFKIIIMPLKYILRVKLSEDFPEDLKSYYINYKCNGKDSGVDLVVPDEIKSDSLTKIDHKLSCQMSLYKRGVILDASKK